MPRISRVRGEDLGPRRIRVLLQGEDTHPDICKQKDNSTDTRLITASEPRVAAGQALPPEQCFSSNQGAALLRAFVSIGWMR